MYRLFSVDQMSLNNFFAIIRDLRVRINVIIDDFGYLSLELRCFIVSIPYAVAVNHGTSAITILAMESVKGERTDPSGFLGSSPPFL